jgi:hypothetical protein
MNLSSSGLLLSRAIDGFLRFKVVEGLSETTLTSYRDHLDRFLVHIEDTPLTNINSPKIEGYFYWLRTDYVPQRITGSTIPYHRDGCPPYGTARQWESHYGAIATQGAEWQRLRRQFPSAEFCMAGDYNQNRDGGRWYGTKWGRSLLTLALIESRLRCVTEEDFIANGQLPDDDQRGEDGKRLSKRSIDHISLSHSWAEKVVKVGAWSGTTESGYHLSDHSGVFADLLMG